jgi:hypothetical protein
MHIHESAFSDFGLAYSCMRSTHYTKIVESAHLGLTQPSRYNVVYLEIPYSVPDLELVQAGLAEDWLNHGSL